MSNDQDLTVTVTDNETGGLVTVTPTSLSVNEGWHRTRIPSKLDTQPTATVTVTISSTRPTGAATVIGKPGEPDVLDLGLGDGADGHGFGGRRGRRRCAMRHVPP